MINIKNLKRIALPCLILISLALLFGCISAESLCGNGLCDNNENCLSCVEDCPVDLTPSNCQKAACDPSIVNSSINGWFIEYEPSCCGNGLCELAEGCNTCLADCSCEQGDYCNESTGLCRVDICGDGLCLTGENCCDDCGCIEGQVCNEYLHLCQTNFELTNSTINVIVNNYLSATGESGTIKLIRDTYYGEELVKEVTINCTKLGNYYPCSIILFIKSDGTIVDSILSN